MIINWLETNSISFDYEGDRITNFENDIKNGIIIKNIIKKYVNS